MTVPGNSGGFGKSGSFRGWNAAENGSWDSNAWGDVLVMGAEDVDLCALRDVGTAGGLTYRLNPDYGSGKASTRAIVTLPTVSCHGSSEHKSDSASRILMSGGQSGDTKSEGYQARAILLF